MLTQTDIERERYEARRKAQLDHDYPIKYALENGQRIGQQIGEKIGEEKGEQVGAILAYERMLRLPETAKEQLLALSLEDLTRLAQNLQQQCAEPTMNLPWEPLRPPSTVRVVEN